MIDPFVGQITIYGFNWAPEGWAICDGASLAVAQNQVLYSLLGNMYGGNNVNFNLPDLRARTFIGSGLAATGINYTIGQSGGSNTFTVPATALPYHTHPVYAKKAAPTQLSPANGLFSQMPSNGTVPITGMYTPSPETTAPMGANVVATTGAGAAAENRQPSLGINFCIAKLGYYPPRQ